MIKCRYTLAELDVKAIEFYTDIEDKLKIKEGLDAWDAVHPLKGVMIHLSRNLDIIIKGRPEELERQTGLIDPLIERAKAAYRATNPELRTSRGKEPETEEQIQACLATWAKKQIFTIFNYDSTDRSFVKKKEWDLAYRHARRMNINTCPYCNANYTYTSNRGTAKFRPQFDHFLNKDMHPYLALSFYNLIPSCALCNSGALKGSNEFKRTTHVHPFEEHIADHYQFRLEVKAVDFLVNGEDFEISFRPNVTVRDAAARSRVEASIGVFGIKDRYKHHKDIAVDVLKKAYTYHPLAIENLYKDFKIGDVSIFRNEKEIKEMILGNYLHEDDFHRRTLSKLTKDIAEEFGLTL